MKNIQNWKRNLHALSIGLAAVVLACSSQAYEYETVLDEMTYEAGEFNGINLSLGLKTAGRFQALDQNNVFITPRPSDGDPSPSPVRQGAISPGFQTAWGSMDFKAQFEDLVEVYWEFFISSRPHPDALQGSQGFILVHGLPEGALDGLFKHVDIKAGEFEIEFGDHIFRRSDNARVNRNPLVGNYVVDPRTTEIGMEVITKSEGPVNGLFGVTSGTATGDLIEDRGTGLHGKVWLTPNEMARLSGSIYWVDHSDNPAGFESGSRNNLYRTNRSGGPYAGVFDDGNGVGEVFVGNGQDVLAYQADLTLQFGDLEIYGNLGYSEDGDTNGSADGAPKDAWLYYAAEGVYQVTEKIHAAVRYSAAAADKIGGADSDGYVGRIQAGVGYRLTRNLIAKLEYVFQDYSDFVEGEKVSGVDAWRGPEFQGVIAEVGFAF